MRTKDTKTWYVKLVGSDTHCNTKEDALDLYKYWASWFDDVALEEYNCTRVLQGISAERESISRNAFNLE